jgi:hypothetical protein
MRTSSRRATPVLAAVAGAAALAGAATGTAAATTHQPGPGPADADLAGDGPRLGDAPAAGPVELMSFSAPRLRSSGLLETDEGEEDGHQGYDGDGDTDFRDDRARDDDTDECGYEYEHTDDGYSFGQCDIHDGGAHRAGDDDSDDFEPYYHRDGESYYNREDGGTRTVDADDYDASDQDGYLEDESRDFDNDQDELAERTARDQEEAEARDADGG